MCALNLRASLRLLRRTAPAHSMLRVHSNSPAVLLRSCVHRLTTWACACNLPISQTYNYGVDSYDLGEGFGHFGIGEP